METNENGPLGNSDFSGLVGAQFEQDRANQIEGGDKFTFTVMRASKGGYMIVEGGQVAAKSTLGEAIALMAEELRQKFGEMQPSTPFPSQAYPHQQGPIGAAFSSYDQQPMPNVVVRKRFREDYPDSVSKIEYVVGSLQRIPRAFTGAFMAVVGVGIGFATVLRMLT